METLLSPRNLLALSLPFVAAAIQYVSWEYLQPHTWFLFYPAVYISTWLGNRAAGILSVMIAALLGYLFVPPYFKIDMVTISQAIMIAIFVGMGFAFVVFHDHLRRSRAKLKSETDRAEAALRTRDNFISAAAHELKTPLTTLKLLLQLGQIEFKKNNPKNSKEPFTKALKQVDAITFLINEMWDVAKIRIGQFQLNRQKTDLSAVVREVVDRQAPILEISHNKLEVSAPRAVCGNWDQSRLEQIIVNLITNVTKYAPGTKARISAETFGDQARLVVADDGPGIAKEKQQQIFEPFERGYARRDVSGLGLGLYLVKQIVLAHNGAIHVESEPGKGSKFIIDLPLNSEA